MPRVNSIEKTITDSVLGLETYIRITKTDKEVTVYSFNHERIIEATWSIEEAHEVCDMLHHILD